MSRKPSRAFGPALGLATLGVLGLAAPAAAFLNSPPTLEGRLDVFPQRDFVALERWEPNTDLHIRVLRDGFEIGEAHGTTGADGILEVNHPGGVCWVGSTPDLLPGDVVQASTDREFDNVAADVDQTITAYVAVTTHAFEDGERIVMQGTAQAMDANGSPVSDAAGNPVPAPLDRLEARIVAPDMRDNGFDDRDLNAPGGSPDLGYTGTLTYDAPGSIHWTAVYEGPGLTPLIRDIAVAGESRSMHWMATGPGDTRLGLTLYDDGADVANGPGMAGCPAGASMGVTGSTPASVNAANIQSAANLRLNGVAHEATAVSVTLDDEGDPLTPAVTVPGTITNPDAVNQTWFATIPTQGVAGSVSTFDDGPLTASAQFTAGERQATGPDGQPLFTEEQRPVIDPETGEQATDAETGEPLFETVEVPVMEPIVIGGAERTIVKDLVLPDAPIATPREGRYAVPQSVELSQTDGPGSIIRYTRNGTVPSLSNGTTFTTDIQITADQTVKARVFDAAGNPSPIAGACTSPVDTDPANDCAGWFRYAIGGPPAAPSAPDLAAADDSGESATDNVTNGRILTFTGTAEAGATVDILDGGVSVGTGASSSTGTYSITVALPAGGRMIQARASNAFGTSNPSPALAVTIDAAAPTVGADLPAGLYAGAQEVALTSSEPGTIRYTRGGTTPDTVYTARIGIASSTTLRFTASDLAGNTSATAERAYTIDTVAPVVSMTAPLNGARVSGAAVAISANASDANGIAAVQFRLDGEDLGIADTTFPYGITWNSETVPDGVHSLAAVATDRAGNSAPVLNGVAVTVSNGGDGTAPTVSLTAPANGATVSGTRAVSASATDNTGGSGVAGVQFLLDGAPLGAEDTVAPYTIQWDTRTATDGTHSLSARAHDRAGNSRTSTARSVTVRNGTVLSVGPPSAALGAAPGPVVAGTSVAAVETAPVVVSWPAASIASGTTYTLQRSLNGGAFQNFAVNGARSLTQQLRAGAYRFRVRAVNGALTATSTETTVVVRTDQETAATTAGAWTTNSAATWWNGSLRFASAGTASTTYTFTGRSFGLVSTRAANRGRLSVSIDGGAATTVDLFNSTQQARRIVFSKNGLAAGSHTVVVRVLGTRNASSTGTRADVDGFVVLG